MILKLLDYLHIVRAVWLLDGDEELYLTAIRTNQPRKPNPFKLPDRTDVRAPVYWFTNTGDVVLLPDGTVQQIHYCKRWKYFRDWVTK